MLIARVIGDVVATQKDPSHHARKILLVQPLSLDGSDRGEAILALDAVDAGIGERVLLSAEGFSAMISALPIFLGSARIFRQKKQSSCKFAEIGSKPSRCQNFVYFWKFATISKRPGENGSFSDTELAENGIEQVLRRRLADNLANGVYGDAQVHRSQLESRA